MSRTLASNPHSAIRPGVLAAAATVSRRLTALRNIFAMWGERMRFRWDLEQKMKTDPHLIDDIGLSMRQVETEIAKPFWRAQEIRDDR